MKSLNFILHLLLLLTFSACTIPTNNAGFIKGDSLKVMPVNQGRNSFHQLGKSDFDRMAEVELAENTESIKLLMLKLYKRNPHELQKSTTDSAEKMISWVFDGEAQHSFQFEMLQNMQGTEAIFLTFKPDYTGDRVLAYIVGLQTMLMQAHGSQKEFYLTDSIDPQHIYNLARNVEIAAWKLSNARDEKGSLFLLSNELNNAERNLSFEREVGKIIGRSDFYAIALAEKSQRLVSRIIQNLATAVFLPFKY